MSKNIRIQPQLATYWDMLQTVKQEVFKDQLKVSSSGSVPIDYAHDILALQHVITEICTLQEKIKAM